MIILYESNETEFKSLGLGVLDEVLNAEVVEELNGKFEFSFEYLKTGIHFSDIQTHRIVLTKVNPFDEPEPFRIYKIEKELKGRIKVFAQHISYDMTNYIVNKFGEKAIDLPDALSKLQKIKMELGVTYSQEENQENGFIYKCGPLYFKKPTKKVGADYYYEDYKINTITPFNFILDETLTRDDEAYNVQLNVPKPATLRTVFGGSDESILGLSNLEVKYNKYNIYLLKHRGEDNGYSIRYGNNLVDLSQETDFSTNYSGIYPYYHTNKTTYIEHKLEKYSTQYYIATNSKGQTFSKQWITAVRGTVSLTPNTEGVPVKMADDTINKDERGDDYRNKVYFWSNGSKDNGKEENKKNGLNRFYEVPYIEANEESKSKTYDFRFYCPYNNKTYSQITFQRQVSGYTTKTTCYLTIEYSFTSSNQITYSIKSDNAMPEDKTIRFIVHLDGSDESYIIKMKSGTTEASVTKTYTIQPGVPIGSYGVTVRFDPNQGTVDNKTGKLKLIFDTYSYDVIKYGDDIVYKKSNSSLSKEKGGWLNTNYKEIRVISEPDDTAIKSFIDINTDYSFTWDEQYSMLNSEYGILGQTRAFDRCFWNINCNKAEGLTYNFNFTSNGENFVGVYIETSQEILLGYNPTFMYYYRPDDYLGREQFVPTNTDYSTEQKLGEGYRYPVNVPGQPTWYFKEKVVYSGGYYYKGYQETVYNFNSTSENTKWLNSNYRLITISLTQPLGNITTDKEFYDDLTSFIRKNSILFSTAKLSNKVTHLSDNIITFAYPNSIVTEKEPVQSSNVLDLQNYVSGGDVQDGVLYLEGRINDPYKKIYFKDFSSDLDSIDAETFNEGKEDLYKVAQGELYMKTKEFIKKETELGKNKTSLTVSFVRLSDSIEYQDLKSLEIIRLGDTVHVYHGELGIDSPLKIKETNYDPVTDRYTEITLGEVNEGLAGSVLTTNDNISALHNDSGYVDSNQVTKIIANTVTADYIEAQNAKMSSAQIDDLRATNVRISGLLEASKADIDSIVAKMLTADNALIKNKLTSGEIEVTGKITALDGEFNGNLNATRLNDSNKFLISANRENGQVIITNANIDAETIKTKEIETQKLTINSEVVTNSLTIGNAVIDYGNGSPTATAVTFALTYDVNYDDPLNPNAGVIEYVIKPSTSIPTGKSVDVAFTSIIVVNSTDGIHDVFYKKKYSYRETLDSTVTVADGLTIKEVISDAGVSPAINFISVSQPTPSTWTYYTENASSDADRELRIKANLTPNGYASFDLGSSNRYWRNLYLVNSPIQPSDRKFKTDINYDLSKYSDLFDNLRPVTYKFQNGNTDGIHFGFIAQDVEDAFEKENINADNYAFLVKENDTYLLRYSELHALEINEIQKLKNEIKLLKEELKKGD